MLKEVKVHLFDTGYCLNFEKMVSRNKPLKIQRFYSLAGLIEHPTLGPMLFDTGYASHVINLCRKIPYFFYSLITPIRFKHEQSAAYQIQRFGYKPEDIKHIMCSHFHPDHIGGLRDFKHAQFHASNDAYLQLKQFSFFKAMRQVFFDKLLPDDFETRLQDIEKRVIDIPFKPFKTGFDLFGDQSIIAVKLPGHALGQYGIFLKTSSQIIFLAADACWQSGNYQNLEYPHPLARHVIDDYAAFCNTLSMLQALKLANPEIEIIPSHCQKMHQKYVKDGVSC